MKQEHYHETDLPSPISVYGQSKLAGENAIHEVGGQHVIFRTSWVIGLHGHNFAKTILRLSMERESLRVVNDQFGVPTTASLIARITRGVILRISRGEWDTGLYHLAPRGETTWYEVARTLIDVAAKKGLPIVLNKNEIQPIATDDYPAKAKRPLSSRLNTKKLEDMLNMELPNWKDEFIQVANEIVEGLKVA